MAMGRKAQVKIDEIDIPKDYFDLKREDKEELCEYIANKIYLMVSLPLKKAMVLIFCQKTRVIYSLFGFLGEKKKLNLLKNF